MINGDKFVVKFGEEYITIPNTQNNIDAYFVQITPYILHHIEVDESDNFYVLKPEKFEDSFHKVFKKDFLVVRNINNLKKYYN